MTGTTEIAARLDRSTADDRLLDHPFYRAWADGTLTTDDLRFYAAQYFNQVEAFPGYLAVLADRLPDSEAKTSVLENLADERDGDHLGLWLRFAAAVGADSVSVRETPAEDETLACIAAFEAAVRDRSPSFALGMIYGYESQTPDVCETKIKGLRDLYGVEGPGLEYFELHGELDVEHAGELAAAVAELSSSEDDLRDAEEGAVAGARAIRGLLDGVARVRGIG
ncbi:MAG TPA: iron-containing redox enzyme family protein [Actinomycetota bacterium]|nr:iron-containing redox enzyme family protein [Actinomycetota bacterium]